MHAQVCHRVLSSIFIVNQHSTFLRSSGYYSLYQKKWSICWVQDLGKFVTGHYRKYWLWINIQPSWGHQFCTGYFRSFSFAEPNIYAGLSSGIIKNIHRESTFNLHEVIRFVRFISEEVFHLLRQSYGQGCHRVWSNIYILNRNLTFYRVIKIFIMPSG